MSFTLDHDDTTLILEIENKNSKSRNVGNDTRANQRLGSGGYSLFERGRASERNRVIWKYKKNERVNRETRNYEIGSSVITRQEREKIEQVLMPRGTGWALPDEMELDSLSKQLVDQFFSRSFPDDTGKQEIFRKC